MNPISTVTAHCIRLNWDTIVEPAAVDALTRLVGISLRLQHGIHTTQPAHDTLEFESSRDVTFATLALSNASRFTLELI